MNYDNFYAGQPPYWQAYPQQQPPGDFYTDNIGDYVVRYSSDGAHPGGNGQYSAEDYAGGATVPPHTSFTSPHTSFTSPHTPFTSPHTPFTSLPPRAAGAGPAAKEANEKFFDQQPDFVSGYDGGGYDASYAPLPAPVAYPTSLLAVPAYPAAANIGRSPGSPFSSSMTLISSPGSSATYGGPATPVPPVNGRTLLKDRYNQVGPTDNDKDSLSLYAVAPDRRRRRGCLCRCCCVFCIVFVLLVGGLVAVFFLAFKQPDVRLLSVEQPANGQPAFTTDSLKFSMNFQLEVAVKNPNFIGITFSQVEGEARFKNVSPNVVGRGSLNNVAVPQNSDQVISFPFNINYDPVNDPGSRILLYVAKNCGFLGGTKGKLELDYTIKFSVGFLSSLGIKPSITDSTSFECPLNSGETLPSLAALSDLSGSGNQSNLRSARTRSAKR